MTILLPIIEGTNLLTHSSTQCYLTCPRKFFLQNRLGLRTAYDSDPLRTGHAFHLGLELLKSGASVGEAVQTIRDTYADTPCPPWYGPNSDDPDGYAVEEETVVAMVLAYHERYKNDQILKTVAVELEFDLPIVNPDTGAATPTFRNAGKIDWIAELPDGRLALVDHKTTSDDISPDSDFWTRLRMDHQISRYVCAARDLGHDVQTSVFDVVRKPAIRPKAIAKADRALATSQGHYSNERLTGQCPERETPRLYGARLLNDMMTRPAFYFARVEIPRLESDLEEWKFETWTIQRTIRQADLDSRTRGASAFPRNVGACKLPYPCPFLRVCHEMTGDITQEIPEGYMRATRLHPELKLSQGANHDHCNPAPAV